MNKTPLWLPEGSIRAIIALLFVGATIVLYGVQGAVPEGLIALDGAVVAWYFKKSDPGGGK